MNIRDSYYAHKNVIYEWRFESEMFKIRDCISVFFYILRTKHIGNIADAQ